MEPVVRMVLDPSVQNADARDFEDRLNHKVIGQEHAAKIFTRVIQSYMAGLNDPNRPVGSLLLLGPTGTGKTRTVEAIAEILFGNPKAFVKLACADYQASDQINRLTGSAPGYVGAETRSLRP